MEKNKNAVLKFFQL